MRIFLTFSVKALYQHTNAGRHGSVLSNVLKELADVEYYLPCQIYQVTAQFQPMTP
jgi:hypothetical protein